MKKKIVSVMTAAVVMFGSMGLVCAAGEVNDVNVFGPIYYEDFEGADGSDSSIDMSGYIGPKEEAGNVSPPGGGTGEEGGGKQVTKVTKTFSTPKTGDYFNYLYLLLVMISALMISLCLQSKREQNIPQ